MGKKHQEEHENLERWLVSYADFITLLFAFFTVLYALSLTDKSKYEKAIEQIQRAFLSGGGVFPLKGTPFVPFDRPAERTPQSPPPRGTQGQQSQGQNLAEIRDKIQEIYENTTGLGLQKTDIEFVRTDQGYKIRLGEYVLFKPGSDKLRREALPFLLEIGRRLTNVEGTIHVEGHTDASPSKGGLSNWHLSFNRASNIVQFLVEGVRFPANRLSLAGLGDTRPVADNSSSEGRARNRRVELAITTREALTEQWMQ